MLAPDRTPVIVGAAQLVQRDAGFEEALEPVAMLEQVAREAAQDAGARDALLRELDTIGVVSNIGWRATNPPGLVAGRLGARSARQILTGTGGDTPLVLLGHVAGQIASGQSRAALIVGCNNRRSLLRARREGRRLPWESGGEGTPIMLGEHKAGSSELEIRYGLGAPAIVYPIFENALRAKRGLALDAHRRAMGALMTRFAAVAANNPHAWFPVARSAEEIVTPSPTNRMIAFPYTKYLNAVLETDQAAALLVCSSAYARSLGIADERQVRVLGVADAVEDVWYPTERPEFAACAALRRAATAALSRSGVGLDQIDRFDLYSCFSVAVEVACDMLGLAEDDPRGFTVTGGLPYAGGPGNAYTLHAVAAMTQRLRETPGRRGLVTGNGWYLTKHSACVLASAPASAASEAAFAPGDGTTGRTFETRVEALHEAEGLARIETYTVTFDRDGAPERGIVVGRLDDGRRFLANTPADRAVLEDLVTREGIGRPGRVAPHDGRNVFEPA